MLKGLIQWGVSAAKTLITNARVGKQVLATGATITTQTTGSGTTSQVSSAGTFQVPVWVWYVLGAALVVPILLWLLSKLFKK